MHIINCGVNVTTRQKVLLLYAHMTSTVPRIFVRIGMLSVRSTSQDNGVSNSRTIDLSSPLCSVHWIPTANAFSSLGPVTLD